MSARLEWGDTGRGTCFRWYEITILWWIWRNLSPLYWGCGGGCLRGPDLFLPKLFVCGDHWSLRLGNGWWRTDWRGRKVRESAEDEAETCDPTRLPIIRAEQMSRTKELGQNGVWATRKIGRPEEMRSGQILLWWHNMPVEAFSTGLANPGRVNALIYRDEGEMAIMALKRMAVNVSRRAGDFY